ncbi:GNAT family N-acetyltransferase [Humibacillus sp. DSM 29435]|uniref:GNAT family N-acetyltransferase n=1 Tax=Humibacillus sp. DSM 29435 TaxID=1869167 RepID=UPI0020C78D18|nr:GNAT family N-acetyltransferase [Humibacillus sp. DSM 29435]
MPETLQTQRLVLRLLGPGDLDSVHALFSSAGHTIGDGPVSNRESTAQWLARRQMRYATQGLAWYGLWTADRTFVGNCGVFVGTRCGAEPEIGYEINFAYRGQGLAREAAAEVTHLVHEAGHEHLWATIQPSNLVSAHIVRSLGYQLVRSRADSEDSIDYYLSSATH